jgi:signal transduction histidine kinase
MTAECVAICAPIGRDAALAAEILSLDAVATKVHASVEALCAAMSDDTGAILIGEEALTQPALQSLVDTLDAQPPWSDVPVIVLAGREFASSARPLHVLGPLRNVMILERPVPRLIFSRTVALAVRSRRRQFELRAYLDQRADLLEREQRVNRMKDEFLMTLSHELRTPLNAIYGWARMLASGQLPPTHHRRAIEVIEKNAAAQTQLVNDLLDVSRAISGKVRLNVAPVDVGTVLVDAVDSVQLSADVKGVTLEVAAASEPHRIAGDRDRLQQIVWNLLSNAIKFTPRNGRVRVALSRDDSHVEIVVSDTGSGIDRTFLPHVFERFRQADAGTTRQATGLGLGLAIVHHLVELHGGSVTVDSGGTGHGTTFRVRLPRFMESSAAARIPLDERAADARRRPVDRLDDLRVLVVDDEPSARELFMTILEGAGAEVRIAASADEGLAIAKAWAPQVILSDVEMPGKDGHAFIKELDRSIPSVAIAVTAHSRPEDRVRALDAGFQWHVPKPVEPSELVMVVASLSDRLRSK